MNSVFLKPVPAIPFAMVDDRLEKHGLNLTRQRKGVVIAGQRGQLLARVRKGEAYFERGPWQTVIDIMDALEVEYGVEVIDETRQQVFRENRRCPAGHVRDYPRRK